MVRQGTYCTGTFYKSLSGTIMGLCDRSQAMAIPTAYENIFSVSKENFIFDCIPHLAEFFCTSASLKYYLVITIIRPIFGFTES